MTNISLFADSNNEVKSVKNISYLSEVTHDKYRNKMSVLDMYLPKKAKNFPTLIYFHGGGLVRGQRGGPSHLAKLGIAVVAVEYRLYPKCKHPEYIEDCAEATAWVFKNISKYGGNPSKIFIGGYSAGSYLAAMIGLDKKYLKKYNIDANKLAGLLLQSGQMISHFTVRKQLRYKLQQGICDENSPMYHIRKTAFPILLQCADNDYPSRQEENRLFQSMMLRYAKQPQNLIAYHEYPGTHKTLPQNSDFQHDTKVFLLKNSAMSYPKNKKQKSSPVTYYRTFGTDSYIGVSGFKNDTKETKIQIANKSFPASGLRFLKLQSKTLPSHITLSKTMQLKRIAPVKEYYLKDGKKNALKLPKGLIVWTGKGNILFQLNKKTKNIKIPQKGKYYTGDGIEIFVDRSPLQKLSNNNNQTYSTDLDIKQFIFSARPDSEGKSIAIIRHSSDGENITDRSKAKLLTKLTPDGYFMRISIPLAEICALNDENIIGLNIQVNSFKDGKTKKDTLSKSNSPSYLHRFHYPLFKMELSKRQK